MGASIALYAVTVRGLRLALRLAELLDAPVHVPFSLADAEDCSPDRSRVQGFASLSGLMREGFFRYRCHIFIAAAGIAVRAVAPHLRDKAHDPAVLVIDQRGRHVISLLSGHLGGGNAMAGYLAKALDAVPVITTATDVEDLPALDVLAQEQGLAIADVGSVKTISAELLAGKLVSLYDPDNFLGLRGSPWEPLFSLSEKESPFRKIGEDLSACPGPDGPKLGDPKLDGPKLGMQSLLPLAGPWVVVTEKSPSAIRAMRQGCLVLHPPLHAGIGCRKGTSAEDIRIALNSLLARHGLAPAALSSLASIEAKRTEKGLLDCAASLGLPVRFFDSACLAEFPVSAPSPKARELFGVEGVCETAALASARAAGGRGRLLVAKTVLRGVTFALALSLPDVLSPEYRTGRTDAPSAREM
jgi:cobalt-precorrin 5A hydrolase